MINNLTEVFSNFLGEDQSTEIKTGSIKLTFTKTNASQVSPEFDYNGSKIKMPSICDLITEGNGDCSKRMIVQQVIDLF
jgi:hypothetical protein